jgi:hypothetical protein
MGETGGGIRGIIVARLQELPLKWQKPPAPAGMYWGPYVFSC